MKEFLTELLSYLVSLGFTEDNHIDLQEIEEKTLRLTPPEVYSSEDHLIHIIAQYFTEQDFKTEEKNNALYLSKGNPYEVLYQVVVSCFTSSKYNCLMTIKKIF